MNIYRVTPSTEDSRKGILSGPLITCPVALGKGGVVAAADKKEGDGTTPAGTYPFRRIFYRMDQGECPLSSLPVRGISPDMGWCDAPDHASYNKLVRLPFGASYEKLWREDGLYNLILVIGHNDDPVKAGFGSAVFLHLARDGFTPTEGCVAFARTDLERLIRQVGPDDFLKIDMPQT